MTTYNLGGDLDSTTHTLGKGEVTLFGTSLDGVVEVVEVGGRRHVDLVLVGKVPVLLGIGGDDTECRNSLL